LSLPRPDWKRTWGAAALLVLPVLVIYFVQTWNAEFIWDDDAHITQNPAVTQPGGIVAIWTSAAARICPLTLSSFWLEYSLWGANPRLFHLVSILLHALSAVVLWRVLLRLAVPGAWIGVALWALHPVQVETVAWITEQKNTQSALFYLLAILFYVRAEERTGRWSYPVAVLFGLLAVASKSSTVVLPAVLALCSWWLKGRWEWKTIWRLVPFVIFAAGSAWLSVWTQEIEGAHGIAYQRGVLERLADSGKAGWSYLAKLAWPSPLVFIYPKWQTDISSLLHWLPLLSGAALFAVAWWRRWRGVLFAAALFIVQLGPVLTLVNHYFLRYSFVGDHFQYLASMVPLALVAAGIAFGIRHVVARHAAVAALLTTCAVLSWRECSEYRSSETLWQATLRDNPDAWMAHNNLGLILNAKGLKEEALRHHQRAVEIEPERASEPHHDLGNLLVELGQVNKAIAQHEKGLAIQDSFPGRTNLAAALLAAGSPDEAVKHFEQAMNMRPDSAQAQMNLGIALRHADEPDAALARLQMAASLDPAMAEIPYEIGNTLMEDKRPAEAVTAFQKALQLNPRFASAYWNLGGLLLQKNDPGGAVAAFAKVIEVEPNNADACNNLAWLLATTPDTHVRDGARALVLAEKACRLTRRQDPRTLRALAAALAETGDYVKAEAVCQEAGHAATGRSDQLALIEKEAALYRARTKWRRQPG